MFISVERVEVVHVVMSFRPGQWAVFSNDATASTSSYFVLRSTIVLGRSGHAPLLGITCM